jgi:hypothetical protein
MRSVLTAWLLCLAATDVLTAQHGFWQPDERVLITSFHMARGIATDQRHVFVSTTTGLEIYDQTFRRWLLPSTVEDGYPVREGPGRIAYDPRERGVWLVTDAQTLYVWSMPMQRWEQRNGLDVPAAVRAQLNRSPDDRDPALAVVRNFAGRDAHARTWPVTALANGERPGTYWASTYGGNFSFIDSRNLSAEPYAFGTVSRGISALARDENGNLYFGGDGAASRTGISRSDSALQRWQQYESRVGAGPQRRVYDMLSARTGVYAAAGDGLFVLRNERWQRVTDADTRALAYADGRVWAGTRGTLGWVDATDNFTRADFPVQDVHALAARNDTLWVGASGGLFVVVKGLAQQVSTLTDVRAIAITSQHMLVMTPRGVHAWDGAALTTPLRNVSLQAAGVPFSLSTVGPRIYVGGSYGLAEWNSADNTWRHLLVPDDIPEGPVFDVMGDNGRIWLATPAGALRLLWK